MHKQLIQWKLPAMIALSKQRTCKMSVIKNPSHKPMQYAHEQGNVKYKKTSITSSNTTWQFQVLTIKKFTSEIQNAKTSNTTKKHSKFKHNCSIIWVQSDFNIKVRKRASLIRSSRNQYTKQGIWNKDSRVAFHKWIFNNQSLKLANQ